MAGDTANPRIWANADVYSAPVGSTAPTNIATAWAAAWVAFGLLGEDGITETRNDTENTFYALGSILVRRVRSRHERTFTVIALEDNKTLWPVLNPGSPTPTTATGVTTRIAKVPTANVLAFGLQTVDGTVTRRIVIPRGEITNIGDRTVASESEMATYELTITVYPASDGTLYTEITNDPQAVTP